MAERLKMDLTTYWKGLAHDAGLPPEATDAILKAVSNQKAQEEFAKLLNAEYVPRPVFQSALDTQRNELNSAWQVNYDKYYKEKVVPEISRRDKELTAAKARLSAFESTYGPLEEFAPTGSETVTSPTGHTFKTEDVQKLVQEAVGNAMKEASSNFATVVKSVAKATTDHLQRFKEPLDIDAWEKFMVEKNLPPDLAYKEFIEPKVRELEAKRFADEKEKYADEKVKDALTRHKIPVDTKPRDVSPFFAQLKDKEPVIKSGDKPTEAQRLEIFREAYREAETATP